MRGDAWIVVALMLGVLTMIALGVWSQLEDGTREEISEAKGALLAGAAAGVLLLLISA